MSDAWISFKRAFGATQRRTDKAQAAIDEIGVQARVRSKLGYSESADGLREKYLEASVALLSAEHGADSNAKYVALGKVKTDARKAISSAAETKQIAGLKAAIPSFVDSVKAQIKQVDSEKTKAKYQTRLIYLETSFAGLMAKAAFGQAPSKEELDKIQTELERLAKEVVVDAQSNDEARNYNLGKAYKDALEKRYGFKIEGAPQTCTKLSKALDILPAEHITHDSLIKITLGSSTNVADYHRGDKLISFDLGKIERTPTFEYTVNGKVTQVDTFTAATLHEVGHSVDDKAGVMTNPGDQTYGGWQKKTEDQVVAEFWADLDSRLSRIMDPDGNVRMSPQDNILGAIMRAVRNQNFQRPDGVVEEDLPEIEKVAEKLQRAAGNTPWEHLCAIGDRAYHKDGETWWSYSLPARQSQFVRGYQWRAPAEWFAELYAASWATKTKPPSGVAAAAAEFMYREKP